MSKLLTKEPPQPYEDPLLYDKAKLVTISHFVDNNFLLVSVSPMAGLIHTIRSRSGTPADLLMLKRELFRALPVSSEYVISSLLTAERYTTVKLVHQITGTVFYITVDNGLRDGLPAHYGPVELESNCHVAETTSRQLIDELIMAFPYTDFSFLS
jgi:hypothetical protein